MKTKSWTLRFVAITQLRTFKTQITTNTGALIFHRLYGSVEEWIKHRATNTLAYREMSSNPVRTSLHRMSDTLDCAGGLFTVDYSESLHTVDCTVSFYIVEKQALKVSTPQKILQAVENSLYCSKVFTLTVLNKTNRNLGKKVFLSQQNDY